MERKILGFSEHIICLYCGKPIKGRYEENELYHECECSDAKKKRQIEDQIRKLKDSIPEEKFVIRKERVLCEKTKDSF